MADWKAILKEEKARGGVAAKAMSDTTTGFSALHKAAMADGAISARMKELIALSIAISRQCEGCIAVHAQACARAGASRDEVADAVSVAILMGGGPSYSYGAKAIEAFDALSA